MTAPSPVKTRVRRVLIWILTPVLILVAALAPLAYLNFLRAAELSPEEFLAGGGDNGNGPVVAVMGASTVHGIGSADFVAVLRQRMGDEGYQFVNAGINGSTGADLLERVDETLAVKPDAAAILVGSNNVRGIDKLQPALRDYQRDVDELARTLADKTGAEVAFYSLQPLREDLDDAGNKRVSRFNEAIAEIAGSTTRHTCRSTRPSPTRSESRAVRNPAASRSRLPLRRGCGTTTLAKAGTRSANPTATPS